MISASIFKRRLLNGELAGTRYSDSSVFSDEAFTNLISPIIQNGLIELGTRFQLFKQVFNVDLSEYPQPLVYPVVINFEPAGDVDGTQAIIQPNGALWYHLTTITDPYRPHKEIVSIQGSKGNDVPLDGSQGISRSSIGRLIITDKFKDTQLSITCSAYPMNSTSDGFNVWSPDCCVRRPIVTYTENATLKFSDSGCIIECDSPTPMTLTIPAYTECT